METVFEEVTTDALGIVQISLFRVENGLLRLQRITTVIEGCQQIRHFNVREVISEDINTVGFGLQLKSVRIWNRGSCEVERTIQAKIFLKADEVAEGSFTETAQVVGIVGVGMTVLLAEVAGEHTHLVQQVNGSQWRVDVSTDDDDGQMTWQSVKQVTAYGFFARSD